jgi:hypothetical protein
MIGKQRLIFYRKIHVDFLGSDLILKDHVDQKKIYFRSNETIFVHHPYLNSCYLCRRIETVR